MRLGVFINPLGTEDDPNGFKLVPQFKEAGYEFIETTVPAYGGISDEEFEVFLNEAKNCGLPVEAANCLFPGIYLYNDREKAVEWIRKVADRSARLGIKTLVFGSGGARHILGDMTEDEALNILAELLKEMAPIVAEKDITIVIEPLEKPATNCINETHTGAKLVRMVNHPNIRLLVDYYHFARENDILDPKNVPLFAHVHTADPVTRSCQTEITEFFSLFLHVLKKNGWDGNLSLECGLAPNTLEEIMEHFKNFPKLLGLK